MKILLKMRRLTSDHSRTYNARHDTNSRKLQRTYKKQLRGG